MNIIHEAAIAWARTYARDARILVYMQIDKCRQMRARRWAKQAAVVDAVRGGELGAAPPPPIPRALRRAAMLGALVRV